MKFKYFALALLTTLGLLSCSKQKNSTTSQDPNQQGKIVMKITSCTPDNPGNSLDYTGQWHNAAATYALNNMDFNNSSDTDDIMATAIETPFQFNT